MRRTSTDSRDALPAVYVRPDTRHLSAVLRLAFLIALLPATACTDGSERPGNVELNVVVPNNGSQSPSPTGEPQPAVIDIQSVEYTIDCLGNDDAFLDNNASFPDEVQINGNLEVVDGRPAPPGSSLINSEVWQGFMDLPPGPCTVQLRARDNDGEVICTATNPITVLADATVKVDMILICDVSFQAPVGMLDLDATFSFLVGNFCPDLFVFNALDSAPIEQDIGIGTPIAATSLQVRFRDGDNTCGAGCDPQSCVPTPDGVSCTPGPDPGLSTTITCTGGTIDCDGNPATTETECVLNGSELGALGGDPSINASAFVACVPPALGGIPGQQIVCTAITTDGDVDCDKTKSVTIDCPGLPPCDPSVIDCDDGNECTSDNCDPSSGVGVCINDPLPAGSACTLDPSVCGFPFPAQCDGAGACGTAACIDDLACIDANPCTINTCDVTCGLCEQPVPAPDGTACDAGLGLGSGSCVAGACAAVCDTTTCPDSGVPCFDDVCNPVDGACELVPVAEGAICDPAGGTPGTGICSSTLCTSLAFAEFCVTPLAFDEPLCNATYDDTLWSGSHRNSYAQASATGPGLEGPSNVTPEHLDLPGAPIFVSFTEPYADGGRAGWATVLGQGNVVIQLDHDTFQVIDTYEPTGVVIPLGVSGAYTAVGPNGDFLVGRADFVSTIGDTTPGDRLSPIELKRRVFILPGQGLCNSNDFIAGMALTYDGHIAFATELGNVFVIPVDAEQGDVLTGVPVFSTNPNCATADPSTLEQVSNSIAVDEDGGIYVVTSAAMYRLDWDGTSLTQAWRVPYDSDPNVSPIRLGPGSGQTPTLMGTAGDDDRFVVIGDGKQLMNLLVIWRDDIPAGWQPIAPGKDPRIACEVPILYGNPGTTSAISEQSIAVRGYSAIVVNNLLTNPTIVDPSAFLPGVQQNLVSALEGGLPAKAPLGIERVDWDPVSQTCSTVWANSTLSIPNGIPSISAQSNLVYGIGQRGGQFGVEGIDFDTGASVLWAPGGPGACDPSLIATARNLLPEVDAVLDEEVVPGSGVTLDQTSCENSVYAATTVGPDGAIYTGTFFGISKYSPDIVSSAVQSTRAHAGVDQALDLLTRAQLAVAASATVRARDFVGRAYRQISASLAPASVTGPQAAYDEIIDAAGFTFAAFAAIEASQDPSADIGQAIIALTNAAALLN